MMFETLSSKSIKSCATNIAGLLLIIILSSFFVLDTSVHRSIFYAFLIISVLVLPLKKTATEIYTNHKTLWHVLGVYILYSTVSVFWNTPLNAENVFTALKIPLFITFFTLSSVYLFSKIPKLFEHLSLAYVAVACLMVLFFLGADILNNAFTLNDIGLYRLDGVGRTENENVLAKLLSIAAIIILFDMNFLKHPPNDPQRQTKIAYLKYVFLFLALVVILTGTVLTGGRGAIIGLLATIMVMGLLTRNIFAIVALICAVTAIGLLFWQVPSVLDNLVQRAGSYRTDVWNGAFELIKQRPIFGHGAEAQLSFPVSNGYSVTTPHNILLGNIVYGGIAGLVLFLTASVVVFISAFKHAMQKRFVLPLALLINGICVLQFSGHTIILNINPEWWYSWIPLILIIANSHTKFYYDNVYEQG